MDYATNFISNNIYLHILQMGRLEKLEVILNYHAFLYYWSFDRKSYYCEKNIMVDSFFILE